MILNSGDFLAWFLKESALGAVTQTFLWVEVLCVQYFFTIKRCLIGEKLWKSTLQLCSKVLKAVSSQSIGNVQVSMADNTKIPAVFLLPLIQNSNDARSSANRTWWDPVSIGPWRSLWMKFPAILNMCFPNAEIPVRIMWGRERKEQKGLLVQGHVHLGKWSKQVSNGKVYTVNFQGRVQYSVFPKLINQVTTTCAWLYHISWD